MGLTNIGDSRKSHILWQEINRNFKMWKKRKPQNK